MALLLPAGFLAEQDFNAVDKTATYRILVNGVQQVRYDINASNKNNVTVVQTYANPNLFIPYALWKQLLSLFLEFIELVNYYLDVDPIKKASSVRATVIAENSHTLSGKYYISGIEQWSASYNRNTDIVTHIRPTTINCKYEELQALLTWLKDINNKL